MWVKNPPSGSARSSPRSPSKTHVDGGRQSLEHAEGPLRRRRWTDRGPHGIRVAGTAAGSTAGLNVLARTRSAAARGRGVSAASLRLRCDSWTGPTKKARVFGKSLFGSSACSGNLDMDEGPRAARRQGRHVRLAERVWRNVGIDLDEGEKTANRELANAGRLPRAPHRAGSVAARPSICRSASCSGQPSVSNGTRSNFKGQAAALGPARRWKPAARRPFLRPPRGMSPRRPTRSPRGNGRRRATDRFVHQTKPGNRDQAWSRTAGSRSTSGTSTPAAPPRTLPSPRRGAASERFAKEGNVDVRWERPVEHRGPSPFDRAAARILRRRRSSRRVARCTGLPFGPRLPRRGRGSRVAGVADGDDVRARSLHGISHNKNRGHEGRAPSNSAWLAFRTASPGKTIQGALLTAPEPPASLPPSYDSPFRVRGAACILIRAPDRNRVRRSAHEKSPGLCRPPPSLSRPFSPVPVKPSSFRAPIPSREM